MAATASSPLLLQPTSIARIEANRANSLHSTGPRTEQGKLASSKNATTFGLTSTKIFVRPDEQPEFDCFQATLSSELMPAGLSQSALFDQILHASWNIRRCFELECDIQNEAIGKGLKDALADDSLTKRLDRVYRYKKMHESTHRRAIADLRVLQTEQLWRDASKLVQDESVLSDTGKVIRLVKVDKMNLVQSHPAEKLSETLLQNEPTPPGNETLEDRQATTQNEPNTASRHPKPQPIRVPVLPGRNEPCHCGSGLKFKRCCLDKPAAA